VNVSYFYAFDDALAVTAHTNAEVAAHLVRSALLFRRKLKRGEITPDMTKDGPHCMDTWRWMFDACRIPGAQGLDWSVSAAKAGDSGDSGHIIVLRQGRFWKVNISHEGQLLGSKDLQRYFSAYKDAFTVLTYMCSLFQYIYDHTRHEHPAVGILAAANRDLWAKVSSKCYARKSTDTNLRTIVPLPQTRITRPFLRRYIHQHSSSAWTPNSPKISLR
jgi:carnitine O-acetyltransferase